MPTRKKSSLAKLSRPRLHEALARERLFAALDNARQRPVVWISGPPGAGKTTLVASYLDARKLRSIWYQLDASDADIGAFFHYLFTAGEALDAKLRRLLTPHTEAMADPIAFGRANFREFFAHLDSNYVLVLDNYQELAEDAVLHSVLRNAIEEIPDSVQIIVVSRALPPNPFARHRTHGKIASIGFAELKLTLDEAQAIAKRRGIADAAAVELLHVHADGWFAGLTLLMEHAQHSGVARGPKPESMEEVFQYFAGELFDAAKPEQQQTLMQTAFLPIMTAHTAERISANPNAHKLLEQLHQRQLFVYRRLGEETTYQYHALFREFLLARAREIFTPVGLRQLARRAAELLWESGSSSEAIELMLQAEDWPAAHKSILEVAPALFASSRWTTLSGWIARLPEKETSGNGWLQFWYGAAHFAERPQMAQERLSDAYTSFERDADKRGQVLTCSAVLRAYHSNVHGEFTSVGSWIERLVTLLPHADALDRGEAMDVYANLLMAFQYHNPSHPFIRQCSAYLVALICDSSIAIESKGYAAGMAINFLVEDESEGLHEVVSAVRPLLEKPAPQSLSDLYLWHYYALLCQARGEFATAQHYFETVIRLADEIGARRMGIAARWFQHIGCIQERDISKLENIRAAILPKTDEGKAIHLCVFHSVTASLLLLKGDANAALEHLESYRRAAHNFQLPLHEASGLVALAAAHLEHGSPRTAFDLVLEGRLFMQNSSLVSEYNELTLVGALAADALEQPQQAREYLLEVFADGLPLFWGIFLSPNNVLANVAALAMKLHIAEPSVLKMIRRYHLKAPSPALLNWPWQIRIRTLGAFSVTDESELGARGRKIQRKPLELLKALVAFGCTEASSQRLAEAVWSELDGDAAMAAFHAALLRLRKLLRHDGLLELKDGKLSLDLSRCWVDTLALEQLLTKLESTSDRAAVTQLMELYQGDFLASEDETPWLLPARERWRRRFLACVARAGESLENMQLWVEAIALYERALAVSNLAEDMYRRLMRCHLAQGHHAQALETYRRCRELLSIVLSTRPSAETDALYRQIVIPV